MSWTIAMYGLVFLTVAFAITSLMRKRKDATTGPLREYLLAANELPRLRVLNLLWAASFSVNGMLYQTYLGYKIGFWALLTQAAWALSFYWLSRYTERIRSSDGLHGALGAKFHPSLKPIAAVFSILSAMALIGWEFNVLQSTFRGLIPSGPTKSMDQGSLIALGIVFSCVFYTILGGMRANALADIIQSFLKVLGFSLLLILLYVNLTKPGASHFEKLPDFDQAIAVLTLGGLLTNLAFSLTWQFVDMSTWQSVVSGKASATTSQSAKDLRRAGFMTFVAPGVLGTLLGIFLMPTAGVDEGNGLAKAIEALQPLGAVTSFLIFLAIASCAMSMIDGLLLVSGFTLIVDVFYRKKTLTEIDSDRDSAFKILGIVRLAFVVLAAFGVAGVSTIMRSLGLAEFMILYVIVVPALALFGPVFLMLLGKTSRSRSVTFVPVFAALVGVSFIAGGEKYAQWAGTATLLFSLILTYLICLKGSDISNQT
ncbi:MAG: hypothetical protein JNL84_13785 [Candidatus Accumulibacter sp.]|nr:hypothetical protein [Accumulibacter sp.]